MPDVTGARHLRKADDKHDWEQQNMKKFILGALLFCCLSDSVMGAEPPMRYVDASTLTIINKAHPGDLPPFARLDVTTYTDLPSIVAHYYRYSTGLAVLFRTDSRNIAARWTTVNSYPGVNTTLICQRGLDLYIRRNNKWIFAGVGTPKNHGTQHESRLVEQADGSMHECLLYLPLFDEVTRLEIGVDEGATLEASPNPFCGKVVVIGSSITHGAAASRPGMAYPARLSRALGLEFVNLGASGQCKIDSFYARIAADIEADAFLFDLFSNPSPQQIKERLEPFVAQIRKAHPHVPLIFLQTEIRESGNFSETKRALEKAKRQAAKEGMYQLQKQDPAIYFLDPGMPLGEDHEATVDGVHPSDLGFDRILQEIRPEIGRILMQHGIMSAPTSRDCLDLK